MISEAEADVVMAKVVTGDGLLGGAMANPFVVFGVEDVIQFQSQAGFVLQ